MPSDYDWSNFIGPTLFAVIVVIWSLLLALAIAVYVLNGYAFSVYFRKVGVKSWIGWVPLYNVYVILETAGIRGWWTFLAFVPSGSLVSSVFLGIAYYRSGIAFRRDGSWVVLGLFLPFVWALILGSRDSVYEPGRLAAAGYPPPLAGFGSVTYNYATEVARPV
jgi:hypothetical protein